MKINYYPDTFQHFVVIVFLKGQKLMDKSGKQTG